MKKVKEMLGKLKAYLKGKKSYVVIVIGVLVGYLQFAHGIEVPEIVWIGLASLLGITYKAGQNRVEAATKEFLDAIKEAKKR